MTTHNVPSQGEIVLAAMYHFAKLPDYQKLREPMKQKMLSLGMKGTMLVTPEGINGTVSGSRDAVDAFLAYLKSDARFTGLTHKESYSDHHPFERTKVKMKQEVISLGVTADPTLHAGTYVKPKDWNALISQEDVVLVDSRNEYETYLGTFKGAIDPNIKTFKQLPAYTEAKLDPKKHKKIATFCTGGIRCEKYTAYLLEKGFEEVYHLEGGILKYLEEIPEEESLWQGECYVFDGRVGVKHGLEPSEDASNCPACGHSLFTKDRFRPEYVTGVCCHNCPPEKQERGATIQLQQTTVAP